MKLSPDSASLAARNGTAAMLFCAAVFSGNLYAQQTEVITLKHRAAVEVVPIIKPLVEPAGSVTAARDQLIVRTTAANLAQVKKVAAAIDHEPRRLLISVRQDGDAGSAPGRVYSTRNADGDHTMQQVRVDEDKQAFMQTGSSNPVSSATVATTPTGVVVADSVRFRDLSTGFYVTPRLVGERVTLDIAAHRDAPANVNAGAGGADTQAMVTTISGKLGEWIRVGGQGAGAGDGSRSGGSQIWRTTGGEHQLLLKVEELH